MDKTQTLPPKLESLLEGLVRGLKELYGERYEGLILYGSYARREADEGSDVDLLLLLNGPVDQMREMLRVETVDWPLSLGSGYVLSVVPVSISRFRTSDEPYLRSARNEGVEVR